MKLGFGCIAVFIALAIVFGGAFLLLRGRRGAPTPSPRGPWSCASCGAKHPERVHPCPHCGHGHD